MTRVVFEIAILLFLLLLLSISGASAETRNDGLQQTGFAWDSLVKDVELILVKTEVIKTIKPKKATINELL